MNSLIVTCDWCSKPFKTTIQRLTINKSQSCSQLCAAELKKSKFTTTTCFICGNAMKIKPSHLAQRVHKDKVTCSRECSAIVRKELMAGEKNHQYGLKGELNASHQSDIKLSPYGYVLVRNLNHPMAMYDGYMFFHRLIIEEYCKAIGEYRFLQEVDGLWVLNPTFIVHHLDENKLNNTLSNLMIMSLEEHIRLHSKEAYQNRKIDNKGRLLPIGEIKLGRLSRNKKLDAGQDVCASEAISIPMRSSALISTGLYINVPKGFVGLLWSRSGLSVKHRVEVGAGCIDSGYHGEVKVHLYNHGSEDFHINKGDRIAQLLTLPVNLEEYTNVDEFSTISDRGADGFGSSGIIGGEPC